VAEHDFTRRDWGPQEFRAYLHEHDDTILDHVGDLAEWSAFKKGLQAWLEDVDAEYDELAHNQEHGIE
jgi:hypothetical protein